MFDLRLFFQSQGQSLKAHRPEEFESVVRCLAERPRVLMYDDCNTQFQDYAGKLTVALTAGVKIQNLAWFVFDSGMAEAEEVDHLMNFQQVVCDVFVCLLFPFQNSLNPFQKQKYP